MARPLRPGSTNSLPQPIGIRFSTFEKGDGMTDPLVVAVANHKGGVAQKQRRRRRWVKPRSPVG